MAQEPSSNRAQQERDQNASEAGQLPEQIEPVEQEVTSAVPEQQAGTPDLSAADTQGKEEEEDSKSPGWTGRESMEYQQRSALDYNEWVNEGNADHNANLSNAQENPVAEQSAPAQEADAGNEEQTDRLQEARDRMNAVNERLDQGQQMESEKVIGD